MVTRRQALGGALGAAMVAALVRPLRVLAQTASQSQTWFGATIPTLPQSTPNPAFKLPSPGQTNSGSYYYPTNAAQLQADVNAAAATKGSGGEVIVLAAGRTYGPMVLTLPARGTGYGTVFIVSSQIPELGGALPAAGARVSLSDAAKMGTILMTAGSNYAVTDSSTNNPSNNYHFVGVCVSCQGTTTSASQCDNIDGLISIGLGATIQSGLPSNITIERCVIAGDATYGVHRGVTMSGYGITVCESYIYNVFDSNVNSNADNQCFACWNGGGGFLIRNNYMNSAGQSFLFGGADPYISGIAPEHDITITNNYLYKNPASLGVAGVGYGKNVCELKRGQRILISGNHMEAGWGSQSEAFNITPRNQSNTNPQSQITDVTFINNRIWNVCQPGMGFLNISGQDTPGSGANYSQPTERILIRNNLFLGSQTSSGGGSQMFMVDQPRDANQQPSDLIIDHNTFVQLTDGAQSTWLSVNTRPASSGLSWKNFVYSNNIVAAVTEYGAAVDVGAGNAWGMNAVLTEGFVNGCCINNAVVIQAGGTSSALPNGNFQPANVVAIGFNTTGLTAEYPNTVGYVLVDSSPYRGTGVSGAGLPYSSAGTKDSTDIGCNVSNLADAASVTPNPPAGLTID